MTLVVIFGIWVPAALEGALICIIIENKSATSAKLAMGTNLILQYATATAVIHAHRRRRVDREDDRERSSDRYLPRSHICRLPRCCHASIPS